MADLALPAGAIIESAPMQVDVSGIIEHRSALTHHIRRLVRSPGRWRGTTTLALQDAHSRSYDDEDAEIADLAARIHAFVSAFDAGASAAIPLQDIPTLDASVTTAVDSVSSAGAVTLDDEIEVADGDFLKIGTRIYQARAPGLGTGTNTDEIASVEPYGIELRSVDDDAVGPADEIEVETAARIASPHDPDFWGPWVIQWVELP